MAMTYPGCGYICLNSSWCDATGSPALLKIRNRELVVPWSMEPTKDGSILSSDLRAMFGDEIDLGYSFRA